MLTQTKTLWALLAINAAKKKHLPKKLASDAIAADAIQLEVFSKEIDAECIKSNLPKLSLVLSCSEEMVDPNADGESSLVFSHDWLKEEIPKFSKESSGVTFNAVADLALQAKFKIIEQYEQTVVKTFSEKVSPALLAAAKEDARISMYAEQVYPLLPLALRWVVKEKDFISFVIYNRDNLVGYLEEGKNGLPSA